MELLVVLTLVIGFFMAWGIGANDTANSMSTAVGAKAITPLQAVFIAAILEFTGSYFFGKHVTETVRKGIINPMVINNVDVVIYGSLSALLAAGVWLLIASYYGLPVSTTHSIIGGIVGYGLLYAGPKIVNWTKLTYVVLSWIISPILGGLVGFAVFWLIRLSILNTKKPYENAKKWAPIWIGLAFFIVGMTFYIKTVHGKDLVKAAVVGLGFALVAFLASKIWVYFRRDAADEYQAVENIFKSVQVITSCYVALAHGANDVANAIGPVAAVYSAIKGGLQGFMVPVPKWILAYGGIGIAIGVTTYGYRVMKTVGTRITELTNTRGFSIDFSAATVVLVASRMGLPISTTHTVVGAVVGVGLARGLSAINKGVLRDIVVSWFVTIPVAAVLAAVFFKIFMYIF